ncbi:FAD-dependent monooxygenase [Streptomyces sp. NPDC002577]
MTEDTPAIEVETLIVGGGIAGLAVALGLGRAGKAVHVLERTPEFGEVGAGIQLAPNAMSVLDRLGVLDAVMKDAVFPQRKLYMDAVTGKRIASIDLGPKFVERYGYPYIVTHRADLHGSLLQACRELPSVVLETNRGVVSTEKQADGRVKVVCADGSAYLAGALIGADGVRSAIRPTIIDDELVPSKYVAYRGTVPIEAVGEEAAESPTVLCWLGPAMHLIQYPLRGGKLYNNVAVFRSDNYSPDHDDWGTEAELDERFGVCCDHVRKAGEYLNRELRWPMYDREPATRWVDGNVALIGDAAHAMLQYLAQGGAQSLDDAAVMAEEFASADTPGEAFRRYEERRLSHVGNVQRLARVAGELFHYEGVARHLRNNFFKDHDPQDHVHLDWMFMPVDKAPATRAYPV